MSGSVKFSAGFRLSRERSVCFGIAALLITAASQQANGQPTCLSGPEFTDQKDGYVVYKWVNNCGGQIKIDWTRQLPSGKVENGRWFADACKPSSHQYFAGRYSFSYLFDESAVRKTCLSPKDAETRDKVGPGAQTTNPMLATPLGTKAPDASPAPSVSIVGTTVQKPAPAPQVTTTQNPAPPKEGTPPKEDPTLPKAKPPGALEFAKGRLCLSTEAQCRAVWQALRGRSPESLENRSSSQMCEISNAPQHCFAILPEHRRAVLELAKSGQLGTFGRQLPEE